MTYAIPDLHSADFLLDGLEDIIQSHGRLLETALARNGHHVNQPSVPQDVPTFRSPTESHMSRPDAALFLQSLQSSLIHNRIKDQHGRLPGLDSNVEYAAVQRISTAGV
jgi:hypothetical protein